MYLPVESNWSNGSPFVQIFDSLGIQSAANILNIVVITAAISAINSDIFGAGRMMYGMAQDKQAPKVFTKLTKSGVPWVTVLVMSVVMLLGVYLNYLLPEKNLCDYCVNRNLCDRLGLVNDTTFSCRNAPPNEP